MCPGLELVNAVLGVIQAMREREQANSGRANMRTVQLGYSLLKCTSACGGALPHVPGGANSWFGIWRGAPQMLATKSALTFNHCDGIRRIRGALYLWQLVISKGSA